LQHHAEQVDLLLIYLEWIADLIRLSPTRTSPWRHRWDRAMS